MQVKTDVHACARVLGGPSDGYFGKTIGVLVGAYKARVIFEESAYLRLLPHPQYDPTEFQDLRELAEILGEQGYDGGMRWLQAACKHFFETCMARGIALPGPNFTISYETDIPRGVGLGENSALVIATLRNLCQWYGVGEEFARSEFPTLAFEVESEEFHHAASLQDRVVQTFGGVVFMDFAQELMTARGYGTYTRIDPHLVPPLFIAFAPADGDTGAVHSDVRMRWNAGDPAVHTAMRAFAELAEQGRRAMLAGDSMRVSTLLQEDADLHRAVFGDAVIGAANLAMLDIARAHEMPATVSGSQLILGVLSDEPQNATFADHLKADGFQFLRVAVSPEYPW